MSDHGLALKPTSAFNGSSAVTMYGDASLDTGVEYTGLVGQIHGTTIVWRSMRKSLDVFSTIETEAQALVALMQMAEGPSRLLTSMSLHHGVPQVCCDNKGAIALAQSEGSWRKTLVAKMRAIRSHLNASTSESLTSKQARCKETSCRNSWVRRTLVMRWSHWVLDLFIMKTDPASHEWKILHCHVVNI